MHSRSIDRCFQKIYVNTLFTYTLVGYTATTATRDDDDDDDDDDVHSHRLIDCLIDQYTSLAATRAPRLRDFLSRLAPRRSRCANALSNARRFLLAIARRIVGGALA